MNGAKPIAPGATYRLQFRNGMNFAGATRLVPYLEGMGISHLYASPVFAATSGSTHGYDIIDYNQFDPALGGEAGFAELLAALKRHEIGLVLDIVPNHMAASLENRWWASVVEFGQSSPYATYFDIDWSEHLTLPILGQPFADALAAGEISLDINAENGVLGLRYYETLIPITPSTYALALNGIETALAKDIVKIAGDAAPTDADHFHQSLRALWSEAAQAAALRTGLGNHTDTARLKAVHAAQSYQLIDWRDGRHHLSYRRFFEVTGLVGIKVENEQVFDASHRLILDLVARGDVQGLRIDHVDGLADPAGYLSRLRAATGPQIYIVVEKILGAGEMLPPGWPIAGTTGYEFIAEMASVLADVETTDAINAAYGRMIREDVDLEAEARNAKREIVHHNLAGELDGLTGRAKRLAERTAGTVSLTVPTLKTAIAELIVAFPIYRTYGDADGQSSTDRALIEQITAPLRAKLTGVERTALEFIVGLLMLDVEPSARADALDFMVRFQQTSGPVMAKAVEDTLYYRRNRLLALNEVGGDPDPDAVSVAAFHASMTTRRARQPEGMVTTATHDTKRGEDARARLYAISEAPTTWAQGVSRWRDMNAHLVKQIDGEPAPKPEFEWLIYQALAGAWPFMPPDEAELAELATRFSAYLEKAMREAKLRTGWIEVNTDYEAAVQAYAARLFEPTNMKFREDFATVLAPFARAGVLNALAQLTLKLTAPGVPDIYQGTEDWDFSLVDPDNRRPVAFDRLISQALNDCDPDALVANWRTSALKQFILRKGLLARAGGTALSPHASYRPLKVRGAERQHVIAFERRAESELAIVIVPRLSLGLLDEKDDILVPAQKWGETYIERTSEAEGAVLTNIFTGETFAASATLKLSDVLARFPVAVLTGSI